MFKRRYDNAGNTGYAYEENLRNAIDVCRRRYSKESKTYEEFCRSICAYYQVDFCEVMGKVRFELENEK